MYKLYIMYNLLQINIFHILFVAPLLFYIGYQNNYGRTKPSAMVYNMLIFLAVVVLMYHGYLAYRRM